MGLIEAGSQILMADWTEKPLEEISVDDEIIGFERVDRYNTRLVKTKVLRRVTQLAEVVESTTGCGRILRHTPDHRFLRPSNGGDFRYVALKLGSKVVSIYKPFLKPNAEEQRDLDWLGGILDGEGSISKTGNAISQQENSNPEIFEGIKVVLERLKIGYAMGMTHTSTRFSMKGGRSLQIRLLQNARMMKKERFRKALWDGRQLSETSGRGGGCSQPKIVSIERFGKKKTVELETTTHNLVCNGFAVFWSSALAARNTYR